MIRQDISIPMGIDPAPCWTNIFPYFFWIEIYSAINIYRVSTCHRRRKVHRRPMHTIHNDVEFSSSYNYVYLKQLDLKIKIQREHAPFLDLYITIDDNMFAYKLFGICMVSTCHRWHKVHRRPMHTIHNDVEFSSSYNCIYPKQLDLKIKLQRKHAPFLDSYITIEDNIFVYKLFGKRNKFPFFDVYMPYLSSKVPSSNHRYFMTQNFQWS